MNRQAKYMKSDMDHRESIQFKNGASLEVRHVGNDEIIDVKSKDGDVLVNIKMTAEGPVLSFSGASIEVEATKRFTVNSPKVHIHADESLRVTTNGDYHEEVNNDAYRTARIQHIKAELGDVKIRANDDVKLDGERIRLNCED